MLNRIKDFPEEINESLMTKNFLEQRGYKVKTQTDLYAAREDHLIGIGIFKDQFIENQLKEKYKFLCEIKIQSEFDLWKKDKDLNEYYITFSQGIGELIGKNFKIMQLKEKIK